MLDISFVLPCVDIATLGPTTSTLRLRKTTLLLPTSLKRSRFRSFNIQQLVRALHSSREPIPSSNGWQYGEILHRQATHFRALNTFSFLTKRPPTKV